MTTTRCGAYLLAPDGALLGTGAPSCSGPANDHERRDVLLLMAPDRGETREAWTLLEHHTRRARRYVSVGRYAYLDRPERLAYARDAQTVAHRRRARDYVVLRAESIGWDYGERGERVYAVAPAVRATRAALRRAVLRGERHRHAPRATTTRATGAAGAVPRYSPAVPDVVRYAAIIGRIGNVE